MLELKHRPKTEPLASPLPAKRPASVVASLSAPAPRWEPFVVGMVTIPAVTGITAGEWLALCQPDLSPISVAQSVIPGLLGASPLMPMDLLQTQCQPGEFVRLVPDWAANYGGQLVRQALSCWPDQA